MTGEREKAREISHEEWLIAAAAWNNVDPDWFAAECAKKEQRMPTGSREAWARVFAAVGAQARHSALLEAAAIARDHYAETGRAHWVNEIAIRIEQAAKEK